MHAAAYQSNRSIRQFSHKYFDQVMIPNVASAMALARGLRQPNCHTDTCSLIFLSSIAAQIGQPANTVYSASKGAINSLTKGLALELLNDHIRVNSIAPAMIKTRMAEQTQSNVSGAQFDLIRERHPMGFGHVDDVAMAAAFLLSKASRFINGVNHTVDGGYMCA